MFKKISKTLLMALVVSGMFWTAKSANAACAACNERLEEQAPRFVKNSGYKPEIIQPVVKNYDCSAPKPAYVPAPEMPVQQAKFVRPAPKKVAFIPNVSTYQNKHLKPLDDVEVSMRNRVSTCTETRGAKPNNGPEFVMSSRSERQIAFGDEPCRDGSIFGGRDCHSRNKNGSIFGGASCKSCLKKGTIFNSEPCQSCKQKYVSHAQIPAPMPAPAAMPAPCNCNCNCNGGVPVSAPVTIPAPAYVPVPAYVPATTYATIPAPMPAPCNCSGNYGVGAQINAQVVAPQSSCPCSAKQQAQAEKVHNSGAIFPGGSCKSCMKKGTILESGSCKSCMKKGTILESGSCKSCMKKGTILESGSCTRCKKKGSCTKCKQPKPEPAPKPCVKKRTVEPTVRDCSLFAPISMEWVDFRINRNGDNKTYSRNLGKYRFRIFGCRRNAKNTVLNEGRLVEKDMNFNEIFTDMVSDCYKIVNMQECIDENSPLPEYVLTAEITDLFLDVCDEYNWGDVRMENSRSGSSEITVVWRLMDVSKTNVLWKGETKGYGKLEGGEYNGETVLVQRAFADASNNLQYQPGFEDQLKVRLSPEEIEQQRRIIMEAQKASGICQPKVVEDFGVVSTGSAAVDEVKIETPEPVVSSAIFEADKLCIVERADIDNMTTEDVCKMRNSVVKIKNAKGVEGAGLLISEQFVMTSADLIDRSNNQYTVETASGKTMSAKAFRANPRRNTALLVLGEAAEYTPLGLNLELPAVGKDSYQFVGLKPVGNGTDCMAESEKVNSYRYTQDGAAEIMIDSFNQGTVIGGVLVDNKGRVTGIAHRAPDGAHLFLPMETAMRSLGVEICGKAFPEVKPKPKVWKKPVAEFIDNPEAKAPEAMPVKNRK